MYIEVDDEYTWVLLIASIISFHYMLTGYIAGGGARGKIFSKEYMQQFQKEHEEAFGQTVPLPVGGNPDMGSGKYSEKLSYKDWFLFNTGQRIHYNYLESVN